MQSFASSPDILQNVYLNPLTETAVVGGLVTSPVGGNLKVKMMQRRRRSPTESTRGSARYDPIGKQPHVTSYPAVVTSANTVAALGSKQLTDEGDEGDTDGSVRDVRDKNRRYAKTLRDIEKELFERLRHRLFPQDPHAKRSECLERGMCGLSFITIVLTIAFVTLCSDRKRR